MMKRVFDNAALVRGSTFCIPTSVMAAENNMRFN